jgi:Na+/H+ antiporter NhaD/arsenite permease-like protein
LWWPIFRLVAESAVRRAHHPATLLWAVALVSGTLSAFFVNDTICLVMTPLVAEITLALGRNPVPYLLALAVSSNIGSAATITGNPQNMIIGSFSAIPYREFTGTLAPVSAAGLVVAATVIWWIYRREFHAANHVDVPRRRVRVFRPLLWKSLTAATFMIAGFFAGWPVPKVALTAGAFVLVTRRIKPQKIYREIDFSLLVLFAGLFIVVAGMEKAVGAELLSVSQGMRLDRPAVLSALAAVLSNLVSNVPAVLVFKPFVERLPDPHHAWLTLAMASTFAGNFTILASVANLIVVQKAQPKVEIGFWEYFHAGAPVTLITLLLGVLWLSR